MKNILKTTAGLATSMAILCASAAAQPTHATAQDTSLLLTAIYAQMDEAREQTTKVVLAKANTGIRLATLRTDALYAYRMPLNTRFMLAHLEP